MNINKIIIKYLDVVKKFGNHCKRTIVIDNREESDPEITTLISNCRELKQNSL